MQGIKAFTNQKEYLIYLSTIDIGFTIISITSSYVRGITLLTIV
jgi:hypothetical protein